MHRGLGNRVHIKHALPRCQESTTADPPRTPVSPVPSSPAIVSVATRSAPRSARAAASDLSPLPSAEAHRPLRQLLLVRRFVPPRKKVLRVPGLREPSAIPRKKIPLLHSPWTPARSLHPEPPPPAATPAFPRPPRAQRETSEQCRLWMVIPRPALSSAVSTRYSLSSFGNTIWRMLERDFTSAPQCTRALGSFSQKRCTMLKIACADSSLCATCTVSVPGRVMVCNKKSRRNISRDPHLPRLQHNVPLAAPPRIFLLRPVQLQIPDPTFLRCGSSASSGSADPAPSTPAARPTPDPKTPRIVPPTEDQSTKSNPPASPVVRWDAPPLSRRTLA